MKLGINEFYFKKNTILYFEDPYRTNGSQLAQEPRKNWMNENMYGF